MGAVVLTAAAAVVALAVDACAVVDGLSSDWVALSLPPPHPVVATSAVRATSVLP